MARYAQFMAVAATAVVLGLAGPSLAGDTFTGFQIDNKSQYFGYLGVRTPITTLPQGSEMFVQLFTAALGYSFETNGTLRDANVQFVVPSIGLKHTFGHWTVGGFAGPQLRRIEEEQFVGSPRTDYQVGAYAQVEAFYWTRTFNFQGIASYADLDNFFWGRLRGKYLVHRSSDLCCTTFVGWDVAGMGNATFRAVQTGPVVEVPIRNVFFLVRGGYQYSTSFRNGAYGGFEVYFPF